MSTFDQLVEFGKEHPILSALYASLFTWGLTALGAGFVFFFKKMNRAVLDGMLGFTGGVMVAASFWSLLAPSIEISPGEGFLKVLPAAIGFGMGALFLFGLDKVLPHLHINFKESEKEGVKTDDASIPYQTITLGWIVVVLVNFGKSIRKFIGLIVYRMIVWYFDKFKFGKNIFHFSSVKGIEAVVVIDV